MAITLDIILDMKEIPLDTPYDPNEKMFSPTEAAEYLGISKITLGRYLNMEKNPMPSYRISNKIVRIRPVEMMAWILKRRGTSEEYLQSDKTIKKSEAKAVIPETEGAGGIPL